jgi:alginate O-acetyltransferase complex protein AlgI
VNKLLFNSLEFLLAFLPIFMVVYGLTPKAYRNMTLLAGSIVFYGYGDLRFLPLLIISVLCNYMFGIHVAHKKKESKAHHRIRRTLFVLALIGNAGLLVLSKMMAGIWGLPLGISFYTFQIISYLADVYRGRVAGERSILRFADYIVMFPKLISGPITRYASLEESMRNREFHAEGIQEGLKVFVLGLALKVLLADRIGIFWNDVQVTGFVSLSTPQAWLGAIAFSFSLYFDFFGYSLMAIGLGRMLGFTLPDNFNNPYTSRSIREFYRRWHITLGMWFRDYIYIPLGGSRRGEVRTIFNLLLVWVLTGLWHGSTLNFLLWGLSLWLFIVLERLFGRMKIWREMVILPHLYLWVVIPVTWMFFAIPDLSQLLTYLGRMFALTPGVNIQIGDWMHALKTYWILFVSCALAATPLLGFLFRKLKGHVIGQVVLGMLFWFCVWRIWVSGENVFMYFRF